MVCILFFLNAEHIDIYIYLYKTIQNKRVIYTYDITYNERI